MPFKATTVFLFALVAFGVLSPVRSAPTSFYPRHDGHDDAATTTPPASNSTASASAASGSFVRQNGLDAQKLNAQFKVIKKSDSCEAGQMACVQSSFAMCVDSKWVLQPCAASMKCLALPLVNKAGTSLVCDVEEDALKRFEAAGVTGGPSGDGSVSATSSAPSSTSTTAATDDDDDCDDDDDYADDDDCDDQDGTSPSSSPSGATPASITSAIVKSAIQKSTTSAPTNSAIATTQAKETITTTVTSIPPGVNTKDLQFSTTTLVLGRRQLITTTATQPSVTPATASSILAPVVTASPAVPTVVSSASSAANGIVTPTVAVGQNGIVTVTLVSTVTVSARDCAPTAIATGATAIVSVLPSPSTIVSNFSSQPTVVASPKPASSVLPSLTPQAPVVTSPSGFSFTPGTVTTTTPPSTATSITNLSELLTAAVTAN